MSSPAGHGPLRKVTAVSLAAVLSLASASQVMVIKLSQTNPSADRFTDIVSPYPYHYTSIPLLSDLLKLAVSTVFLMRESPEKRKVTIAWWSMRLYIVPGVCYFLHNNLMFMVLGDVQPWAYMIIANLKIATTAVMFRLLLGRKLTKLQWHALVLLVVGTLISQIDDCSRHGILAVPYRSLFKGFLLGFFSAMAGTYTEMFLRANDDSLYWQNCQMYAVGVASNSLNVLLQGLISGRSQFPLLPSEVLAGFNTCAWLSVLVLASAGLLVSWIMKYTNTVVKVYSNIAGMALTIMASYVMLDIKMGLPAMLGFSTVCTGSALYYLGLRELFGVEAAREFLGFDPSSSLPSHTRASTHPSLLSVDVTRTPESSKGT
mmetsp:Transcript_16870/g.47103  ORF Transcript_16870/g.47103 Transcript_16870/m.47103 type:complete len:374 (+) Transcript_16870:388-1509(+)|eukprot:CAMPEP_0117654454 /NCGR_PEP_ID=MMETSP0804-20121206/3753_1 /TAXON_ID=1074897 /ORGANISM="Tetraselmis astigmatica, Strain CCMP880" /LENGTH=373 /DNA_ID=CAMNT_0005460737 /DNA_START=324 /DNA_END=1445 /DNA_ORIENTATION=+